MILLGLTGSIGMGKSVTAQLFTAAGAPVFDADAAVHRLYAPGGAAVEAVQAAFPGVVENGAVDRERLSQQVTGNQSAMRRLEAIVHPLVRTERRVFLELAKAQCAAVAVLDVPLLFETGGDAMVDAVVVVSASSELQRERVLARAGMTEAKLAAILALQVPDSVKRARADFVIDTGAGIDAARAQVEAVLKTVTAPGFRPRRARPSDALDEAREPPH